MSDRQVLELARYRIQQAHDSLREAGILVRERSWRGAINRAYYAMFYAVLALAVVEGYSTSKHAGVLAFFDREYVKKDVFSKALSQKMHLAFERRQTQDYGEFVLIEESTAQETLADATEFVDAIETYLLSSVFPSLERKD
jgi:uncharacterized protein (UPF0332 family)